MQILLVEKGTCFALWKDVIDNLSKYTDQGRNSIHFRIFTKIFMKRLTKMFTKKLSKTYTKNFTKLEVGTCLLFKFGFVKIFVKIFVRILKCIELGPCWNPFQ